MNDPIEERTLTEGEKQEYQFEGYLLLRGLLSPESALAVHEDVLQIMDRIGLGMTALRQTSEYLADTPVAALVNSPNLQKIATQLLEGEARLYLPFTAVKSPGGGGAFHYHQDNQYARHDVRYTRDFGQTWKHVDADGPGWQTGPVENLTIPEGQRDGH